MGDVPARPEGKLVHWRDIAEFDFQILSRTWELRHDKDQLASNNFLVVRKACEVDGMIELVLVVPGNRYSTAD